MFVYHAREPLSRLDYKKWLQTHDEVGKKKNGMKQNVGGRRNGNKNKNNRTESVKKRRGEKDISSSRLGVSFVQGSRVWYFTSSSSLFLFFFFLFFLWPPHKASAERDVQYASAEEEEENKNSERKEQGEVENYEARRKAIHKEMKEKERRLLDRSESDQKSNKLYSFPFRLNALKSSYRLDFIFFLQRSPIATISLSLLCYKNKTITVVTSQRTIKLSLTTGKD